MSKHRTLFSAALCTGLALCAAAPARAADVCQTVASATGKIRTVPVHLYMTETAAYNKSQPRTSESIYTGNAVYVMVKGKWRRSPVNLADLKKDSDEKVKETCRYQRDESVDGEAAAVYSTHTESEDFKSDTTVWISKSRNVLLKSETDMDVGGTLGKSHTSTRYDYAHVQAPAGVK